VIDPDQVFDREHDRDAKTKIGERLKNENRGSILIPKSRSVFRTKIGLQLIAFVSAKYP
jgi:hypothetical protein